MARRIITGLLRAGYRAHLTLPLLGADRIIGALVVRRKEPGEFSKSTVDLLQTFGAQSVLAIQNARLFQKIEEKGRKIGKTPRSCIPLAPLRCFCAWLLLAPMPALCRGEETGAFQHTWPRSAPPHCTSSSINRSQIELGA